MPWCEECAKFWTPSSMQPDGTCPTCGRVLATPQAANAGPTAAEQPALSEKVDLKKLAGEDARAPWHFKLLMVALVVYLGWRFLQLLGLLF
jgi:hypothetical protein